MVTMRLEMIYFATNRIYFRLHFLGHYYCGLTLVCQCLLVFNCQWTSSPTDMGISCDYKQTLCVTALTRLTVQWNKSVPFSVCNATTHNFNHRMKHLHIGQACFCLNLCSRFPSCHLSILKWILIKFGYYTWHWASFSLLETVQRPWWSDTGHTGSVDGAELDFRDVESDGGGLQSGLHNLQRTSQNSAYCTTTSRRRWGRGWEWKGKETKRGTVEERDRKGENIMRKTNTKHCLLAFKLVTRDRQKQWWIWIPLIYSACIVFWF